MAIKRTFRRVVCDNCMKILSFYEGKLKKISNRNSQNLCVQCFENAGFDKEINVNNKEVL